MDQIQLDIDEHNSMTLSKINLSDAYFSTQGKSASSGQKKQFKGTSDTCKMLRSYRLQENYSNSYILKRNNLWRERHAQS